MKLGALLSQICLVAMLVMVAALPSAAWAHENHEHAGAQFAAAKVSGAEAVVSASNSRSMTTDSTSPARDASCNGACCGFGCCGGCTMALVDEVSQVLPPIGAMIRVSAPRSVGGPGTVPEALPKPPKSYA